MFEFTPQKYTAIRKLRPALRDRALRELGKLEFKKCAADPVYWLDSKAHPVPYVYTLDEKPLATCNLCGPEFVAVSHAINRRQMHLRLRHGIEKKLDPEQLDKYFKQLPAIRPFTLKPYMPPIIRAWVDTQYFAMEKSRDMMATWLMVALGTWDTFFHEGRKHIFQSQDATMTLDLVERAALIAERQPKWLRDLNPPEFVSGPARSGILRFKALHGQILGFPQGPDQIRGLHPTGIFVDEAAFQVKAADAFKAIKPAILEGGKYYAISSANPGFFEALIKDISESL